jgi:hypothetical protein
LFFIPRPQSPPQATLSDGKSQLEQILRLLEAFSQRLCASELVETRPGKQSRHCFLGKQWSEGVLHLGVVTPPVPKLNVRKKTHKMYFVHLDMAFFLLSTDGLATVGAALGHGSHVRREVQVQSFGLLARPCSRGHGRLDRDIFEVDLIVVVFILRFSYDGLHCGRRQGDILKADVIVIGSIMAKDVSGFRFPVAGRPGFGSRLPRLRCPRGASFAGALPFQGSFCDRGIPRGELGPRLDQHLAVDVREVGASACSFPLRPGPARGIL